ncbi:MAG: hypothetical protein ACRDL3_06900, partial [Solirubrobacterales bacterium]
MDRIKGIAAALAAVAALGVGGAAIASATGGSDDSQSAESAEGNEAPDQAIGGSALDRASAAALEHTGGGQVTDTEVGDEESYYEVEV